MNESEQYSITVVLAVYLSWLLIAPRYADWSGWCCCLLQWRPCAVYVFREHGFASTAGWGHHATFSLNSLKYIYDFENSPAVGKSMLQYKRISAE